MAMRTRLLCTLRSLCRAGAHYEKRSETVYQRREYSSLDKPVTSFRNAVPTNEVKRGPVIASLEEESLDEDSLNLDHLQNSGASPTVVDDSGPSTASFPGDENENYLKDSFLHPDYFEVLAKLMEQRDHENNKAVQDTTDIQQSDTYHPLPQVSADHVVMPDPPLTVATPTGSKKVIRFFKPKQPVPWWGNTYAAYLRDSCICPRCVDPYSKQKNFQTTDIPMNISAQSCVQRRDGSLVIRWSNDVPGFETTSDSESEHITILPPSFLESYRSASSAAIARCEAPATFKLQFWNKNLITQSMRGVSYKDLLIDGSTAPLYHILKELYVNGIVIIRGVPSHEESVVKIASRIGTLRDTFYGRTWDVKSVPKAENVAYTAQHLGLHMDLLYMANPPGLQLLHCIKNSADGGESIFSDSFRAANELNDENFASLVSSSIPYHYKNAGEHYYHSHPVITLNDSLHHSLANVNWLRDSIENINYSPPFQDTFTTPIRGPKSGYAQFLRAMKALAAGVESDDNLYEYKLQEGECVIFNNRRVLHGRRQFSTTNGERWLKGAYVDTDVFMSRWRVMRQKYQGQEPHQSDSNYIHSLEERTAAGLRASTWQPARLEPAEKLLQIG